MVDNEEKSFLMNEIKNNSQRSVDIENRLNAFNIDEKKLDVYFEEYLPAKYKDNYIEAKSILSIRNICIILSILEIGSSLWGFSYYFIRRSIIYVVVNLIAMVISLIGVYSNITMSEIGMIFYTLFTTSIPGTFFIFQIFEYIILKENTENNINRLSDNFIMFIFIIPYAFDLIAGIVTLVMMYRIAIFNDLLAEKMKWKNGINREALEEQMKIVQNLNQEEIRNETNNRQIRNKELCFICQSNMKDCIFQPCNHICICFKCYKNHEVYLTNCAFCPKCKNKIAKGSQFYRT